MLTPNDVHIQFVVSYVLDDNLDTNIFIFYIISFYSK